MAAAGDSLILRSGLIRPEQLAEAQRLRLRSGGTVGEWLVRLGALSEEQLVDFYHRRLLVPRIAPSQLLRVSQEALSSVPADMAVEFRVFPVSIDAQKALTLAMADPSDTHVAEEVAFYSGRHCHRAVAPASAIQDAVERHYRARPAAHAISPRSGPNPATQPLPAQRVDTLDGLRPISDSPRSSIRETRPMTAIRLDDPILLTDVKDEVAVLALGPDFAPRVAPQRQAVPQPIQDEPSSKRQRFVTQTRLAIPIVPAASPAPPPDPESLPIDLPIPLTTQRPSPAPSPTATPVPRTRARTIPGLPMIPDVPLDVLRAAASRDEIAFAMLAYVSQFSSVCALLVMRKGALAGQDGRGVPNLEALRQMVLPIEETPLFREVAQSRSPSRKPADAASLPKALIEVAGAPSGDLLLLPICVGERVIAVLYAAGLESSLPDAALAELARESGAAYERLILNARR